MTSLILFLITIQIAFGMFYWMEPEIEVLVSDVSYQDYIKKIGPQLGIQYLKTYQGNPNQNNFTGIIWGSGLRAFVNMPVRLNHRRCNTNINVIFKIDTGAPITTITTEVADKLFARCQNIERTELQTYSVQIAGREFIVDRSKAHFENLNILGANYMRWTNADLRVHYSRDLPQNVELVLDVNVPDNDEL